jgi:hypothetical protein
MEDLRHAHDLARRMPSEEVRSGDHLPAAAYHSLALPTKSGIREECSATTFHPS